MMANPTFNVEDVRPWHPKLTPYRLGILATTIGFGTAKMIETSAGNSAISTTLEWIIGTLIFIIFFGFSSYDGKERVPNHLRWLFAPDCMDIVWSVLSALSIERPKYTSTERQDIESRQDNHSRHITLYRLVVSCTVCSFGIFKAALSYFGAPESMATTWIDWSIAVPLTTIIYVLGLYEYNSSNIWLSFYLTDRTDPFFHYGKHFLVLSCYTLWFILSSSGLAVFYNDPTVLIKKPDMKISTPKIKSLTEVLSYYTMLYLVIVTLAVQVIVSLCYLFFYSPTPEQLVRISISRTGKFVQFGTRSLFRSIQPLLPISANSILGQRPRSSVLIDVFQRLCGHILLHTLALGLCLFYIVMMTCVTMQMSTDFFSFPRSILGNTIALCICLLIIPIDLLVIAGTLFLIYSLFFRFESL